MSDRLESVQALRGVAAMGVLIFHLADKLDVYTGTQLRPSVDIGQAGVDLFFVISGFVMAHSARDLSGPADASDFMVRRFWRIVPLLYVVSALNLLQNAVHGRWIEPERIANNFLILPAFETAHDLPYALSPAWTLAYEMLFYALVAVVIVTRSRLKLSALVAILVALPLLPVAWPVALSPLSSMFMLEFAFGVAIYGAWTRNLIARRLAVVAGSIGLLLFVAPISQSRVWEWGLPCALLFACGLYLPASKFRSAAAWFGTISYSLYLCHLVVFNALGPLLPAQPIIMATMIVPAAILASWAAYRYIELPILRSALYRPKPVKLAARQAFVR